VSDATSTPKFSCPTCRREFVWRPQIAGKNAKCKCGETVHVPEDAPPLEAPEPLDVPEPLDEDGAEYGVAADENAVEQSHHRCPSCGQAMQPGTVLCLACGYNIATRQRMHTAVGGGDDGAPAFVPSMPKAAAAVPENRFGIPGGLRTPVMRKDEGSQFAALVKPAIILGVLLLVGGAAVVGLKFFSTSKADAVSHPVDKEYLKLSEFGEHEMKDWVTDDPNHMHMVQGMNDRQAVAFADKLYNMGAVKVVAFGGQLALKAGVELPKEPDKRKALFEWQTQYHAEQAIPAQVDEGQKYMVLNLKLLR
jgi:hypothetical protein